MNTQYGTQCYAVGLAKPKIVEWFLAVVKWKNVELCAKLEELEIPKILVGLMRNNPMNSCLLASIYNVIAAALSSGFQPLIDVVGNRCIEWL